MVRPRSPARRRDHARLAWQVLLIVPPVVILSVMALYWVRQDSTAIDQDARRTAAALVPDLARRWGDRAGSQLASLVASACSAGSLDTRRPPAEGGPAGLVPLCGLVVDGRIRVPRDYSSVPSPPEWLQALTPAQARAWRLVADAPPHTDPAVLREAAASLADAPSAVRANAEWSLVRANVNRGVTSNATQRLVDLANRSAGIASESGAPLPDLALLLAFRHLPAGGLSEALLQDLQRRVAESPSLLTPAILEEAERVASGNSAVARLRARWTANERALGLLRQVSFDAEGPAQIWLDTEQGAWVAFVHPLVAPDPSTPPRRTAYQVTLVPGRLIERVFEAAASGGDYIPTYAVARIRLGDRGWRVGQVPSIAERPELASATGHLDFPLTVPADTVATFAGELLRIAPEAIPVRQQTPGVVRLNGVAGGHPFTIALDLTNPDLLYASYRRRLWMAIGLILTATLAAFGGLAATWRAFERQRRLGDMKSEFVANVSHELRAPVAAVRLMAESLERGAIEPGARQQTYLRVISQECRRLSSLVENVLDFSRIDRGRRQFAFAPADLPALLAQTVEVMRPYAAERQVKLVCQAAAGAIVPPVRVDHEALQQALVNLLDNAIKHSPAGADIVVGLDVDAVETGMALRGPARIRLFVDDHGPGIPADEQEAIFEPFYRRGSELRRETRGIGIGLSIVKHIAEAHGGRVVVRSSPGEGSRFAIELPVSSEPAP